MTVMSDRTGQLWAHKKDPERIRFIVKQVPQSAGENEVYLAYHYDECFVEEFETECLEDDDDWERLV